MHRTAHRESRQLEDCADYLCASSPGIGRTTHATPASNRNTVYVQYWSDDTIAALLRRLVVPVREVER